MSTSRLTPRSASKSSKAFETFWIVISAYDGGTIDASDSYYDLFVTRVRMGVGIGA